jgi:hypothetical protein
VEINKNGVAKTIRWKITEIDKGLPPIPSLDVLIPDLPSCPNKKVRLDRRVCAVVFGYGMYEVQYRLCVVVVVVWMDICIIMA